MHSNNNRFDSSHRYSVGEMYVL